MWINRCQGPRLDPPQHFCRSCGRVLLSDLAGSLPALAVHEAQCFALRRSWLAGMRLGGMSARGLRIFEHEHFYVGPPDTPAPQQPPRWWKTLGDLAAQTGVPIVEVLPPYNSLEAVCAAFGLASPNPDPPPAVDSPPPEAPA